MSDICVSDVLEEANNIYTEIASENDNVDNIDTALDMAEEVGASIDGIKAESISSENLKLLKINLESILGFDLLAELKAGVKLEDGTNRSQSKLIQESIRTIVRDFWEALKNAFNALWARLKTWYITVTSASESLIKKATKLRNDADKVNGIATERKFDFKAYKTIHTDGKVSSPLIRGGLKELKAILDSSLNVRTTNEVENFIQAAEDALDNFVKQPDRGQPDSSWVNRFSDIYTPTVAIKTSPLTDKFVQNQIIFDSDNAEYKISANLPGNKAVVYSELKNSSSLPMADKIALISGRLVNTSKREFTEQTVSAETLHPAQIIDICDSIIELNEQITFFEKAWQRRDKFMSRMLKALDTSISKIDNEEVGESESKVYKKTMRSIVAAIKRSNTYNASLLNLVLSVSSGCLAYCSASLSLYKD